MFQRVSLASKLQRRVNAFRCRGVGAAEELWSDRSFLLAAARRNPDALLQVDEAPQIPQTPAPECSDLLPMRSPPWQEIRADWNFMLAAVGERGQALASCAGGLQSIPRSARSHL